MDLFLSYKLDQCKGCISFFFKFPMWPAVTSWVNPVYLSGLRHTDQHSHFDSQPSVRPIVRGDRGELQPLATALFMQTP